jgi:hypothetical protein
MIAVNGPIQRESEVVHLIVQRVTDLSPKLPSIGDRDAVLPVLHGRDDQTTHGGSGQDRRGCDPRVGEPRHLHPRRSIRLLKHRTIKDGTGYSGAVLPFLVVISIFQVVSGPRRRPYLFLPGQATRTTTSSGLLLERQACRPGFAPAMGGDVHQAHYHIGHVEDL